MSTIHNPTNFDPANYEVVDYHDNRRPGFFGQPIEIWKEEIEFWKAEMKGLYGEDWIKKIRKCSHCGNGNLRYIACVEHTPTGERIVMGSSCVNRVGFKNKKEFELAKIKSRAEARAVKIAAYHSRKEFIEQNPGLKEITEAFETDSIENFFIKDVIWKLNQYGRLSEHQVKAVIKAWDREKNPPIEPDRGPAPEGRVIVIGKVLATKLVENDFGQTEKMLVELENLSKVWVTVPISLKGDIKGKQIELTATFTVSKDDKSFAYGKRPRAKLIEEEK